MIWPDRRPQARVGRLVRVVARPAPVAVRELVAILVLAVFVAACGGSDVRSSDAATAASPAPATAVPLTAASPAANGTPALQPIVVDARLLAILPARVEGVEMQAATDTAARMIADPALGRSASAIAVGIVIAAGNSRSDDVAISSVVQLRPGVFDDAFYGAWRRAYDEGACAQAGGIASHVQRVIGPHTVEETVCSQGARMYHTHLAGDVLISITAVGDRKFGDRVMAGLRQ